MAVGTEDTEQVSDDEEGGRGMSYSVQLTVYVNIII